MIADEKCEYLYCKNCKVVRYEYELKMTGDGLKCPECGGNDFEESGWVQCPFHKCAVKCAVAGKGLNKNEESMECLYHCNFFVR